MATELTLPDVGDNIEKGTVVSVLVNVGDTVTEGQPIIELETDGLDEAAAMKALTSWRSVARKCIVQPKDSSQIYAIIIWVARSFGS